MLSRTIWPAAKFKLLSGVTFFIPLGMPNREQVFDAIVKSWKVNRIDTRAFKDRVTRSSVGVFAVDDA